MPIAIAPRPARTATAITCLRTRTVASCNDYSAFAHLSFVAELEHSRRPKSGSLNNSEPNRHALNSPDASVPPNINGWVRGTYRTKRGGQASRQFGALRRARATAPPALLSSVGLSGRCWIGVLTPCVSVGPTSAGFLNRLPRGQPTNIERTCGC